MQRNKLSALCLSAIAAALLLPSTASMASCCPEPSCCPPPPCCTSPGLKDGFYLGAGVGYDSYKLRHNRSLFTSNGITFESSSRDRNATGWMGGLFAGYGMYFQNVYYLGAEVFVNDSAAQSSESTQTLSIPGLGTTLSTDSTQNVNVSYGVSLLPGYKINCDTLAYIRLGYTRARFKDQENGSSFGSSLYDGSNSQWFNGYTYGLGLETAVACNLSLRGEYTHTNYNSQTNTFTSAVIDGVTFSSSSKVSPSDNQFMLSLIYHIC